MSKPNSFISSSDFATLKNSQAGLSASITVPGSSNVPASSYLEWHTDIPITESYAIATCRIASSKNSNRSLVGNATNMDRSIVVGPDTIMYNIYTFVWRVDSVTVRFQAIIQNPYPLILTTAPGDETFSLYMYTFVPPFA